MTTLISPDHPNRNGNARRREAAGTAGDRWLAQLSESCASLQTAIERAPVPIFGIQLGAIAYANDALSVLTGRSPADLVHARISELVVRDDAATLYESIDAALSGVPTVTEVRVRGSDGTVVFLKVSLTPIELDGERAVLAIGTNVSERRWMEAMAGRGIGVPALIGSSSAVPPSGPRYAGLSADEQGMLSPRELEVLSVFASGNRVREISKRLFISPYTVRNHLKSIFRKLRVNSQVALLAKLART
jgi:PAS domain S-box-containing protein